MALLVFVSTFSFAIESHYCGDILVDISWFGEVESCGIDGQHKHTSEENDVKKEDCCNNEVLAIDGQEELKITLENFNIEQQLFVVSFIYSYINLFEGTDSQIIPFKNYSPPHLIRDVQTLDQTFLI
jgi:hypothetical protein